MESFFEGWLSRQEQLLAEMQAAPCDHEPSLRQLVDRVFAHYHEFFHEKSRVAARDVLLLYSPPWLNPYERTFLWISGWRPMMAFALFRDVREDQRAAVDALRRETAAAERELAEEMARVQEAMAMPQVLGLVRGAHDGQLRSEAVQTVISSLQILAASADALRGTTVVRLVELMSTAQTVDFLASAAQLHLRRAAPPPHSRVGRPSCGGEGRLSATTNDAMLWYHGRMVSDETATSSVSVVT